MEQSNSGLAQVQTASAAPTGLPLRKDEFVSGAFLLQTLVALVVLLGTATLILKWVAKKMPGRWQSAKPSVRRLSTIESMRVSARTRLTLVNIDGVRAAVMETPQGASLQFLPSTTTIDASRHPENTSPTVRTSEDQS